MLTCSCHTIYIKQRHLWGRCQSLPKVRHAEWQCHRFMSQVWHVPWRLCVRCHRFGMWCVRCHRFGMCHGVCASDVMASVRQMSCHVMLKLLLRIWDPRPAEYNTHQFQHQAAHRTWEGVPLQQVPDQSTQSRSGRHPRTERNAG